MTKVVDHIPLEDSRAAVYRVLGPPGCGKTSFLISQAERAALKYGPYGVRVVSMTRTASKAFALKKSTIPAENISTLHALAYRAIGKPGIFGRDDLAAWNARYPNYELSGSFDSLDGPVTKTFGDALMLDFDMARSRCVSTNYPALTDFAELYEEYKLEIGKVDFTGMLEEALLHSNAAPGNPDVLLVDEAQDLSTLELKLIEKWAESCKTVVLCGDADQSLYGWRGADPRVLINDSAPPFKILGQSYRVPRVVQEFAMSIIHRSPSWSKAEYAPKREDGDTGPVVEGELDRIPFTFAAPSKIVDDLEVSVVDNPLVDDAMLLAQCGYMLDPIIKVLRNRGIGYHNPYRHEWNPLARGDNKKTTAADRVLAFSRLATGRDWRTALQCLASHKNGGAVLHGQKSLIETIGDDASMSTVGKIISKVLAPEFFELFEHGGSGVPASREAMEKFFTISTKTAQESMKFAHSVYMRSGQKGVEFPKVVVGTIHSVKGGEAEHVYLSTDLSPQARRQMQEPGWDGVDSIWRTFYVGATRSKFRLIVCGDITPKGASI